MINLIIAYSLIAVVLLGYGTSIYRRLHGVARAWRALDGESKIP